MSSVIRVMTVDDHQLLRRGIRFSLLSVDDIEVVARGTHERVLVEVDNFVTRATRKLQ